MSRVTLSIAGEAYDHSRDLFTGAVPLEGIDPVWLELPAEEMFQRFIQYREWDVSECSTAQYVSAVAAGDDSLTAIPVFPCRMFRHSAIYVRPELSGRDPATLVGGRIGVPEWAQTASVYARGLLTHEYGVPLEKVHWVQAGVNQAGRKEHADIHLPDGVTLERVEDRSLNEMLLAGDLDAVISARPPRAFSAGDPDVVRLFPDARRVEQDYVARTGVYPIMHLIVLRREVAERHRWVPGELFKGYVAAKNRSVARMLGGTTSPVPVPWINYHAEQAWRDVFAGDPWPYGVDANVRTLETFLRWSFEQGVCARRLAPSDLFWPGAEATYRS